MLKVECESCKSPYQVDERRIPPTGLKMRCPKCGKSLLVTKGADAADPPRPALRSNPGNVTQPSRDGSRHDEDLPVAAPDAPFPAVAPPRRPPGAPPRREPPPQ